MKKTFSTILVSGLISLSGFREEPAKYEQITFDFFISDILGSDFKNITTIQFKGKTEESYSTLGDYKFCLKPEKLGSIMEFATKESVRIAKEISYEHVKGLTILDFQEKASSPKLFLYPELYVADNHYVFILFQKPNEQPVKYVFEVTPEGNISRSCMM